MFDDRRMALMHASPRLAHGDICWTPARHPLLTAKKHYGIYDQEAGLFLHNDIRGVGWCHPEAFTNGLLMIERRASSVAQARVAIFRARELIGTPYDLVNFNCEGYVNYVVTGQATSKQVGDVGVAALLGLSLVGLASLLAT
jgi:hypothetical protein